MASTLAFLTLVSVALVGATVWEPTKCPFSTKDDVKKMTFGDNDVLFVMYDRRVTSCSVCTCDANFKQPICRGCAPTIITDDSRRHAHHTGCYYQAVVGPLPKCCRENKVCKGEHEFNATVLEERKKLYHSELPEFDYDDLFNLVNPHRINE